MSMMAKTVTCWHYSVWRRFTIYYEPLQKGGIEPSQHPAVKEDEWLAQPNVVEKVGWTQGHTKELIRRYLLENGPSTVTDIADGMDSKTSKISGALSRNPDLFVIVGHKMVKAHMGFTKAAIWGLQERSNGHDKN